MQVVKHDFDLQHFIDELERHLYLATPRKKVLTGCLQCLFDFGQVTF